MPRNFHKIIQPGKGLVLFVQFSKNTADYITYGDQQGK